MNSEPKKTIKVNGDKLLEIYDITEKEVKYMVKSENSKGGDFKKVVSTKIKHNSRGCYFSTPLGNIPLEVATYS